MFRHSAGVLRTSDFLKEGIQPRDLKALVEEGFLEKVSRGVYRLSGSPLLSSPDLVTVAMRIPQGVICLVSALSFYDLTTKVPTEVQVALKAGSEKPRLEYPPAKYFWMSGKAFSEGVEVRKLDGVEVRVYSVEKSLADCFKYRNKIGLDVALEALRLWAPKNRRRWDKLLYYARVCRVERTVRPYLEALS